MDGQDRVQGHPEPRAQCASHVPVRGAAATILLSVLSLAATAIAASGSMDLQEAANPSSYREANPSPFKALITEAESYTHPPHVPPLNPCNMAHSFVSSGSLGCGARSRRDERA